MARSVGIELTPAQVRIVHLEHGGKRSKILQVHEAAIPPGDGVPWEERASAALKEACGAAKIPRNRIVTALESGEAILREVSLPFKNEDQVRKTVRFEMESLIHTYTIEQLVVSHFRTGETDKGTLLLAAAVPKEAIARRLKLFQDAGVDPVALDLDVAAVFNALSHAGAIDTDEPHLLVYGTPKFTKLVFIEGRRPKSIRTLRFSLGEAAPAPATTGTLRSAEDDGPPPEDGFEPVVIVAADEDPPSARVEILAKEISRFLLANAAGSNPAHVLLAGEFDDARSAEMLQAATGIPARRFDLLGAFDHPFGAGAAGMSSRIAAALGLALKGAGVDALGFDFRQDEFQFTKKFETLKTTGLVTLELAIVLLAAIGLHLWFKRTDLQRATGVVLKDHQSTYETATGETLADADRKTAYNKLAELFRKAQLEGGKDLPIRTSAREAWRSLFDAIAQFQRKHGDRPAGDGTLFLEIDTVDFQQTTVPGNESLSMTMRGKIRNVEFAGLLKNEIRTHEVFANADFSGRIEPIEGGLHQFTLQSRKGR